MCSPALVSLPLEHLAAISSLATPAGATRSYSLETEQLELLTRCVFPGFSQDSLAAEIEGTMRKELQLEESESPDIA